MINNKKVLAITRISLLIAGAAIAHKSPAVPVAQACSECKDNIICEGNRLSGYESCYVVSDQCHNNGQSCHDGDVIGD